MAEIALATTAYMNGVAVRRIVYNAGSSSYPARPTGVAAGLVEYLGPVQPTDWLDYDTWIDNS